MKVHLAGFNVDTAVLGELEKNNPGRVDITPEVISAAYARISRDPRKIEEIRQEARQEVERARKSNKTIIFKMGHHSVAEHAVFNLDIVGVSRLAMEEIEKFRLCSYTEKSQRYITLDRDFIVPEEIRGTPFEEKFVDLIALQNNAYHELFTSLKTHIFKKYFKLSSDPKNHSLLEGWAKEDARYVTALATESQVGQTINARNLELLLRRFASHPLLEVRNLGHAIYNEVSRVAPSIIIFHEANDHDQKTYPELKTLVTSLIADDQNAPSEILDVELIASTPGGDDVICAALIHASSCLPYDRCRRMVSRLSRDEKGSLFKTAFKHMQFYDSVLREFELVNLTFNAVVSAACFGQLKRHRMATIVSQGYDPRLGITVPDSIREIGKEKILETVTAQSAELYHAIKKEIPVAAPYVLTNGHRRRVIVHLNLRELYHISRLRQDAHAQWDIRNISRSMVEAAAKIMPFSCALIGPKDHYSDIYCHLFGCPPKVTESVLPGERKIK